MAIKKLEFTPESGSVDTYDHMTSLARDYARPDTISHDVGCNIFSYDII